MAATKQKLPVITKGGVIVDLDAKQKSELSRAIKKHGPNSIEVRALIFQFSSEAKIHWPKPGKTQAIKKIYHQYNNGKKVSEKSVTERVPVKTDLVKLVLKSLVGVVDLEKKVKNIIVKKYNLAQKGRYEQAAKLRLKELEYDKLIEKAVSDLRKLSKRL